jgi:hypothetical protein
MAVSVFGWLAWPLITFQEPGFNVTEVLMKNGEVKIRSS